MRHIRLETELTDEAADGLAGTLLDDSHYDLVIREDAKVYRPDGELLLAFRRRALDPAVCAAAYRPLRTAAQKSGNRGMAAGRIEGDSVDGRPIGKQGGVRFRARKRDGTISNTNHAIGVESGIVGYFDRNPRFPYCRLTAFNLDHPDRFATALPFIRAVDRVFAAEVPNRYAAQKAMIDRTHPDFRISGTVFTTVTVNRNWRTAVHKDAGDLREGFGVLSVLQAGSYSGGLLVLPKFRVAVDIRSTDVLLVDVHQWHGNTPIVGESRRYERISCVFYYRERMADCGSSEEELESAKALSDRRIADRRTP